MNLHTVSRTTVGVTLGSVKYPIDRVARVVGRSNGAATSGPELLVDRADADLRDLIGRMTLDPELRADARQRRAAADERERALRLRGAAADRDGQADERLATAQKQADDQRERAAVRTQERKHGAATVAQRRKTASAQSAKAVSDVNKNLERRQRLQALDKQAAAADERERALTAADEAQRLAAAAARAKAARKQTSKQTT